MSHAPVPVAQVTTAARAVFGQSSVVISALAGCGKTLSISRFAGETACATKKNQALAKHGGAGLQPARTFFRILLVERMTRLTMAAGLFAGLGFSQAAPMARPANRMEISLERLDVDNWRSVDPGLVLEQGDRIRFVFHANFDGYLYVMHQSSTGKYQQLFPPDATGQDGHVGNGNDYRVPATAAALRLAGPPGHERVYWLVSPVRLSEGFPRVGSDSAVSSSVDAPRCDDGLLRSRGDCIDTAAGFKPLAVDLNIPPGLGDAAERSKRDLLFTRRQDTAVISVPAPLGGPVIYQFVLAHR